MATRRITAETLQKMAPGDQIWDTEVRGFGVRCRTGGGDKVYCLKTRIKGRQVLHTIGRDGRGYWGPESARREAIRLLGLIRDGQDPAAEKREEKQAPTLDAFAARYMAERAAGKKRPSSIAADERLLRLHILPALGRVKLRDLARKDVARLHTSMKDTPVAANRAIALLSAVLGWAEKVGERPDHSNPCRHVERNPEQGRERFLDADELARLGDALTRAEADGGDWRPVAVVRLLLLTGARLSEVVTLRWDYVDFDRGIARLPTSKTGAKNLFLPPAALEIMAALPRMAGNPFLIPGDKDGAAYAGIQKAWRRIRALAGLDDVHLHDLRHSYASAAISAGDSLYVVGKLLGHRQAATTQRYAHLQDDPAKAAADRTGARIAAMMTGGTSAEIVPMRPAKKG